MKQDLETLANKSEDILKRAVGEVASAPHRPDATSLWEPSELDVQYFQKLLRGLAEEEVE